MKKLNTVLLGILCLCGGTVMAQYRVLLNFNISNGYGGVYSSLSISGNTLYGPSEYGGGFDSGTAYSIDTTGGGYTDIHDFHGNNGSYPIGSLVVSGNRLYGMGAYGGAHDSGSIFVMNKDGSGYRDIYDFSGGLHGREPIAELLLVGNKLYGATLFGGANANGMVFSIDTDGTGFTDLFDLAAVAYGNEPFCGLTLVGNSLYGITPFGGAHDSGAIFAVNTDGTRKRNVLNLNTLTGFQAAGTLAASGGRLYGATYGGGTGGLGTVFSVDTDGTGLTILYNFTNISGGACYGPLLLSGTTLVGMCAGGAAHDSGCIFSIQTNGTGYTDIHDCDHTGYYGQINGMVVSGETIFGIFPSGGTNGDGVVFSLKYPTLSVANVTNPAAQITVFPNPSNGSFTMQLTAVKGQSTVEFYTMLGEKVYSQSIISGNNTINMNAPANGVYIYRIISDNGSFLGEGKLVIQK